MSTTLKSAMVVGSTGLTGNLLLRELLNSDRYRTVISLSRRLLDIEDPKLMQYVFEDYDLLDDARELIAVDDLFCCLGTTMKKAGSKAKFKMVDYTYPLKIAEMASKNHTPNFFLVSSMGADPDSFFFYNRVKGEVERDLQRIPFESIQIFRPSLILGNREEKRGGEGVAQKIMPKLPYPGKFKKYKPISAETIAKGMMKAAEKQEKGVFVYESDEIVRLATAN